MDILKEKLGKYTGGKILDVATGDGYFINLLINNLQNYLSVVGVDTDREILEQSGKTFKNSRVSFEYMSGDDIKFDDNSFDTVAISNSLHHMKCIDKTLREMYRVLKPGGNFIINEIICDNQNEKQLSHVYFHHLQAEIDTLMGICHNKTFAKNDVIKIAENIGFIGYESFVHENKKFNQYVNIDMFKERYRNFVEKVKECPEYEKYRLEFESLAARLDNVGVEFASQLMIIGRK